jgi:hypothetical protein
MAPSYRYASYHPVGRYMLAPSLRFRKPEWSQIVGGNGTFTGIIAVPNNANVISLLKIATAKKQSAIYVINNATGQIEWGGPVIDRKWDPNANEITVTAVEWRAWLSWVFIGPEPDLSSRNLYSFTSSDQLLTARDIVALAIENGTSEGRPNIVIGTETSGVQRDLNFTGLDFKRASELIDSMSRRDNGFEWTIESRYGSDGLPQLYFVPSYPERGGSIAGLTFLSTPGNSNLVKYDAVDENGATQRERQWATGAGQPPDQIFAQDTDPALSSGGILLREDVTNYSSVVNRSTLASHARAERLYYAGGTELFNIQVTTGRPDAATYFAGDRGRLRIKDRWIDWDLPAVRIISKKTKPEDGVVEIALDLNDSVLPEVDPGGLIV